MRLARRLRNWKTHVSTIFWWIISKWLLQTHIMICQRPWSKRSICWLRNMVSKLWLTIEMTIITDKCLLTSINNKLLLYYHTYPIYNLYLSVLWVISLWWLREPLFERHLSDLHLFDAFDNPLTTAVRLLFDFFMNSNHCLQVASWYVTTESASINHDSWAIFA